MRPLLLLALLLGAAPVRAQSLLSSAVIDYETGPLYVFRNDNRYGPGGTLFTAKDVGQQRNLVREQRLSVELWFAQRHGLILLYAPLELVTTATLPNAVSFRDVTFPDGDLVQSRYLFDGYRASYLYRLVKSDKLTFGIGASLQIRNAAVQLTELQGTRFASETDIGLVFAVKARLRYAISSRLWAMLEADGISDFGLVNDVNGSLLDAALTLGFPLADDADLFFRLRLYGGGADVTDRNIYAYGWFGAATVGLRTDLVSLFSGTAQPQ